MQNTARILVVRQRYITVPKHTKQTNLARSINLELMQYIQNTLLSNSFRESKISSFFAINLILTRKSNGDGIFLT